MSSPYTTETPNKPYSRLMTCMSVLHVFRQCIPSCCWHFSVIYIRCISCLKIWDMIIDSILGNTLCFVDLLIIRTLFFAKCNRIMYAPMLVLMNQLCQLVSRSRSIFPVLWSVVMMDASNSAYMSASMFLCYESAVICTATSRKYIHGQIHSFALAYGILYHEFHLQYDLLLFNTNTHTVWTYMRIALGRLAKHEQ